MPISITAAAQQRLKEIGKEFRFGLRAGGCVAFSYLFETLSEEDRQNILQLTQEEFKKKWRKFCFDGILIYVDNKSYLFLNGTEIDWVDRLMGKHFVFNNKNVVSSCGCGESVDIKPGENNED